PRSNESADPLCMRHSGSVFWSVAFALIVGLATALTFLPTLYNGFVNWDDPGLIVSNPRIRSLDWEHLKWMFTSFHMGPYEPLPLVSLALDYVAWGMDPRGFHLSSIL